MKRRDFLAAVGIGLALTFEAHGQQVRPARLGYIGGGAESDDVAQYLRRQFVVGMRDLGYIEGRDYVLEARSPAGQPERVDALARELVDLKVDVIVAGGELAIRAAKRATTEIPIVMTLAGDPVGAGLVSNLARPGGNLTGMSALASDLAGKRVELLKELVPDAKRICVLWNPGNQSKVAEWKDTQAAARSLGLTLLPFEVRTSSELERALAEIKRERPDAMIALTETLTLTHRKAIGEFALASRLPMVTELREFVVAGGLASYGTSRADLWRRSATYVVKLLRGARPGDLPIEQPTRFDLVVNLKTAKALGVVVAPSILSRADEVIE